MEVRYVANAVGIEDKVDKNAVINWQNSDHSCFYFETPYHSSKHMYMCHASEMHYFSFGLYTLHGYAVHVSRLWTTYY